MREREQTNEKLWPILINYRKSSIRIRPCIILDSNFLRLVLEVFQKLPGPAEGGGAQGARAPPVFGRKDYENPLEFFQ